MPALASLKGYQLPSLNFQPLPPRSYFSAEAPEAPPPDTSQASKLTAHAAIMANVAKEVKELPVLIQSSYLKGKEDAAKAQSIDIQRRAMEDPGALQDMSFGPDGSRVYKPGNRELEQAKLETERARALRYSQPGAGRAPTMGEQKYNAMEAAWGPSGAATGAPTGQPAGAPAGSSEGASGITKASSFAMVPDGNGGWMHDPNDITDAHVAGFSATKGAFGHDIKDPELAGVAVSPAKLRAAGIDPKQARGTMVRMTGPDGVERVYPVVDLNGTDTLDLTQKAYMEMGGPMEKGGGHLPGVKYEIIKPGQMIENPPAHVTNAENTAFVTPPPEGRIAASAPPADISALGVADLAPISPNWRPGQDPALKGIELPTRRPPMARQHLTPEQISRGARPAYYEGTPERMTATYPGGKTEVLPTTKGTAGKEGMVFNSAEEAKLAGYDPTGADVLEGGKIRITAFKPSGTDARGRAKITDTQKNALGSAAVLAKSIDGLMDKYDELDKTNMVGPLAGRIEKGKQAIGIGSEQGSKVQAEMNTALFKIARMLNGAGVLTDADIARATATAPTITMGRGQFKGQLEAVKGTIKDSLETWLQTNAGQATDEQVELAKTAIHSLSGGGTPSAGGTTAAPASGGRVTVTSQAEYDALPVGTKYVNEQGLPGTKAK